jgi:hypothetical protein
LPVQPVPCAGSYDEGLPGTSLLGAMGVQVGSRNVQVNNYIYDAATRPAPFADHVGTVNVVDRYLTVPDGTNSVIIRLAVTNISREHHRLRRLVVNVAESRPSDAIRLFLAGAPLEEYDLAVDLRGVSSVDALNEASHQFVLPPGGSEAFRITATVTEGTRYKLVIHPEFESIAAKSITAGLADQLSIDFPFQSVEALKRAGLI